MHISLRHEWTLVHIVLSALILMVGFFSALFFLLPESFSEVTLYYLALVPYVLVYVVFETSIQDPHALPLHLGIGYYALVIYSFFFAMVAAICRKRKIIPLVYVGLYVVLALVFEKLFWHVL